MFSFIQRRPTIDASRVKSKRGLGPWWARIGGARRSPFGSTEVKQPRRRSSLMYVYLGLGRELLDEDY